MSGSGGFRLFPECHRFLSQCMGAKANSGGAVAFRRSTGANSCRLVRRLRFTANGGCLADGSRLCIIIGMITYRYGAKLLGIGIIRRRTDIRSRLGTDGDIVIPGYIYAGASSDSNIFLSVCLSASLKANYDMCPVHMSLIIHHAHTRCFPNDDGMVCRRGRPLTDGNGIIAGRHSVFSQRNSPNTLRLRAPADCYHVVCNAAISGFRFSANSDAIYTVSLGRFPHSNRRHFQSFRSAADRQGIRSVGSYPCLIPYRRCSRTIRICSCA